MEFYDIGKQCKLCAQHDYLPFLCDCCGEYYCLAHRDYVSHSCSKAGNKRITSETCPSCNREIKIDCSKDLEAQLRNHFVNECTHVKKSKTPKCPVKGCGKKLYASSSTMCSKCHTKFCLAHRFPDTHDCKCQAGKLESPSLFAQLIKRVSLSKARDQAQEESLPEETEQAYDQHTATGPYVCKYCEQCFFESEDLREHYMLSHPHSSCIIF